MTTLPQLEYWCGCGWKGPLPYPQPTDIAMCPRCACQTAVPKVEAVVEGGTLHAIKESERALNSTRRLSHYEMDLLAEWAKTLDDGTQEGVLCLINEARAHRKLLGALHDELINDMC